jgi:hypothetical protein
MKYYITDDNFNVLSVHPDRESAKAVWDVNWKAGVDVYLESEENHLKNIEWAKAYKQRAIERKKRREEKAELEYLKKLNNKIGGGKSAILEDIIIKESLNEIKVNHEIFEDAEDEAINTALKVMEEEYKLLDMLVKKDLERVKPMSFEFEEAAQREAEEEDNK